MDPRSGTLRLNDFCRAGLWDPVVGDANDLSYAPSGVPLKHAAPEVRVVPSSLRRKSAFAESTPITLFGSRWTPYLSFATVVLHFEHRLRRVKRASPTQAFVLPRPRWCVAHQLWEPKANAHCCPRSVGTQRVDYVVAGVGRSYVAGTLMDEDEENQKLQGIQS